MQVEFKHSPILAVLIVVAGGCNRATPPPVPTGTPGAMPGPMGKMMGGATDSPLVGKPAPLFSLTDSEGKPFSLQKTLKSQAVVIYFYKGVW